MFCDLLLDYYAPDYNPDDIENLNIKELLASFDYIDFMIMLETKLNICYDDDFLSLPVINYNNIKEYLGKKS